MNSSVVSLPTTSPEQARVWLELEDGPSRGWKLSDLPSEVIAGLSPGASRTGRLPPDIVRPADRVTTSSTLKAGVESVASLVISAPARCPAPEHCWGAFMPLYALSREVGDWGTGSFSDLAS